MSKEIRTSKDNLEEDKKFPLPKYDEKEDIYKDLLHGKGQNILREALQIADHTSYHSGEIIALRRMLKAWKNS